MFLDNFIIPGNSQSKLKVIIKASLFETDAVLSGIAQMIPKDQNRKFRKF